MQAPGRPFPHRQDGTPEATWPGERSMYLLTAPASAAVFYAFRQSDSFARLIVLLLFLLSIHAWTIMVEKGLVIRRARRGTSRFVRAFREAATPMELVLDIERHAGPLAYVYQAGIDELVDILDIDPQLIDTYCRRTTMPRSLSGSEVEKVRSTLERAVDLQVVELESRLGLLGTSVTVSPFLGLLGTVWGVMAAFCELAQRGRPDIGALAPGISGALLTTVVGLLVAIPALVGFNLLTNSVRLTTVEMDSFVEDFVAQLKLQVDKRPS